MTGLIQSWFVRVGRRWRSGRQGRPRHSGSAAHRWGQADPQMVATFREQVKRGRLSVPPTAGQEAFLHELEWERRRGGFHVR